MRFFYIVLCAAVALAKPQRSAADADGRIIGGEEAPLHEFPWQISLRNAGSHICGGTIINQNQVITAAHCVEGTGAFPILDTVIAGAHHRILEGGHQKRSVKSIEHNEDYNTPHFCNDVALVTVKVPFNFTDPNVQPIEMFLSSDAEIPAETICNSTGWGQTSGIGPFLPNALQWAQLPIRTGEECADIFPSYLDEPMVCAGSVGLNTCNGDSGGPLVCPDENGNGKLAGIVSFGLTGCKNAGVFTKVSNYEDWITARLEP